MFLFNNEKITNVEEGLTNDIIILESDKNFFVVPFSFYENDFDKYGEYFTPIENQKTNEDIQKENNNDLFFFGQYYY